MGYLRTLVYSVSSLTPHTGVVLSLLETILERQVSRRSTGSWTSGVKVR